MLTPRIVQPAPSPSAPLLVVIYLGSALDDALRAAWPEAAITNLTGAPRSTKYAVGQDLPSLRDIAQAAGVDPDASAFLALVGFSEGCQGLRAYLRAGAEPSALVAVDGIHASSPPLTGAIWPYVAFAEEARQGTRLFLLSHTAIVPPGYLSTTATAELIAAPMPPVEAAEPAASPLVSIAKEGRFEVLSFSGADAAAHIDQARRVLPQLVRRVASASRETPRWWGETQWGASTQPPATPGDLAVWGGSPPGPAPAQAPRPAPQPGPTPAPDPAPAAPSSSGPGKRLALLAVFGGVGLLFALARR